TDKTLGIEIPKSEISHQKLYRALPCGICVSLCSLFQFLILLLICLYQCLSVFICGFILRYGGRQTHLSVSRLEPGRSRFASGTRHRSTTRNRRPSSAPLFNL